MTRWIFSIPNPSINVLQQLDGNIKKTEEQFGSLNANGIRAMSDSQEAPKEMVATISEEFNGILNGNRLIASDEIQSNKNKADESSGTVTTSDRIPLNENTNGSQIQGSHDGLVQKRKVEEPLENEENSTPAKKAAMNQTNEAFNAH